MSSTNTQTAETRLLVPAAEAAKMMGIGRSTFWTWVRDGKAPAPVKIGGITRWKVSDLQQCVQAMPCQQ